VEFLERLESLDTLLLLETGVDDKRGEVAILEDLVQFDGALDFGNKYDDLVELECIEEIVELLVLLGLLKADVVLLKAVESELGVIVDEDFHGLWL
jgi:hypothetical protein